MFNPTPLLRGLRDIAALPRLLALHQRFKPWTMVRSTDFVLNLQLAKTALKRLPQGAVVECGSWKGGMAAALVCLGGPQRDYLFFDSFEGLPPVTEKDGPAAHERMANAASYTNGTLSTSFDDFMTLMKSLPCPQERIHVHKGFFKDTLPGISAPPLAVLRLDGDWYDSTMICLETFWDRVLPGGLILIDDYYVWEGCRRAFHDFLSRRSAPEPIRQTRFGSLAFVWKEG
jgi:O-methyltransferase